ncbi:MAG: hypothetical protein HYS13_04610 [Planctomycetia bacterium]|nr:hypothetical protein [Planctomycetia bacterium]
MGTYLSAFIEVDHGDRSPPFSDPEQIYSLTEGSFSFGWEYDVFDALAAGRSSTYAPEDREDHPEPLFAPRGMPSPQSLTVAQDFFFLIADRGRPPDRYFWPAHRCVEPHVAEEWASSQKCVRSEVLQWFNCQPEGIVWPVISEPGLYNASWLLLHEFDAALEHHGLQLATQPVEYTILRTAMSLLADKRGAERVRLVLWFS